MKCLVTFLLLVFVWSASYTQNAQQNLMKYWKHRSQLDRFILKGEGINPSTVHGSYLPAEHRRPIAHPGRGEVGADKDHYRIKWEPLYHTDTNPTCGGLNIGPDATMYMGWFIGVLATEYMLAVSHGVDGSSTLHELWAALEAYERLDKMAETLNGQSPDFNGYFLRDDVIFDLATRDDNNDGISNFPGIGCAIGKFEHKIAEGKAQYNNFPADPYDVTVLDVNKYDNSPSPDQVLGLLMGMALVKRCVEPNAFVNGQSVRLKAQNIAHKIGSYAKSRKYQRNNPDGNGNSGTTDMALVSYPIGESINWITDGNDQNLDLNQDGISGDALSTYQTEDYVNAPIFDDVSPDSDGLWKVIWREMITQWSIYLNDDLPNWPPDGYICALDAVTMLSGFPFIGSLYPVEEDSSLANSCWNMENPSHMAQMYTAAAISNEWSREEFRDVAAEIDMEIFPLLSDVLFGENNMNNWCRAKCKQMIDMAPCNEFGSCGAGSNCLAHDSVCGDLSTEAVLGWMSPNRYLHKDWAFGEKGNGIEHNGLDFLLLYNLYHLKYPEEMPDGYNNIYSDNYSHSGDYPKPVDFVENPNTAEDPNAFPYDIDNPYNYRDCTSCLEAPRNIWSNKTISSNANLGTLNGVTVSPNNLTPTTFYADITYRAGEEIIFTDGFSVTDGATMHAYIDPFECENGMLMRLGEEEPELESELQNSTISRSVEPKSTLYPNPTTGLLTLSHSQQLLTVEVYDPLGRQLQLTTPNTTTTNIDLSGQPAGIYIIRAGLEDGSTETHRVVLSPP